MAFPPAVTLEQYLHQAQFALFACQMVEETLKSILMYAREVNAIARTEYALIQNTDDKLDELPLGALTKRYEMAFSSSSVAAALHALRLERNHCAHRALVLGFMSEVVEGVSLQTEFNRIESAGKLAWSCFESLKIEMHSAANRLKNLRVQDVG